MITPIDDNLVRVFVVAGVLLEKDNKVLLVQEKKPEAYGLWNLPAGKVEKGFSIEETAAKEAKEETGFDVKVGKEIGIYHKNTEKSVKHAFAANIIGGKLNFPDDEILAAKWFSLKEIEDMKDKLRNPWVWEAIKDYLNRKSGLLNK